HTEFRVRCASDERFHAVCPVRWSVCYWYKAPANFVTSGISYGIAPRVMFDFLNWPTQGRVMHLVNAFWGIYDSQSFNDPHFVRRQYPATAALRTLKRSSSIT